MGLSETCPRPSASLLFIAYNHEAFVEEALLSALRQDVATFELVVVVDGKKVIKDNDNKKVTKHLRM